MNSPGESVSRCSASAKGEALALYSLPGEEPVMTFTVEIDREDDGRWLAEVVELPGVLVYGDTRGVALSRVQGLALRVIVERLDHGEASWWP